MSDDHHGESSVFTGAVNWVQIDLGDAAENAKHQPTPQKAKKGTSDDRHIPG